jgi:hypothetical protein
MLARLSAGALLCFPIAVGATIMVACDASVARWGLHIGVGALGFLSYLALARAPKLPAIPRAIAAVVGVLVLASTLLADGIDGVHRWHELGSLRIHPSALLGPALLVFAASHIEQKPLLIHAFLLSVQGLHVLQPDAGQATAFGLAAMALLAPRLTASNVLLAVVYGASIAGAWLRPDPLPPAPFVEDIYLRAFQIGPAAGAVAVIALVPAVLSPFLVARRTRCSPEGQAVARALAVYLVVSALVVLFGEFPIPLLGFGPSPALGAFFGLAALQRFCARSRPASAEGSSGHDRPPSPDAMTTKFVIENN